MKKGTFSLAKEEGDSGLGSFWTTKLAGNGTMRDFSNSNTLQKRVNFFLARKKIKMYGSSREAGSTGGLPYLEVNLPLPFFRGGGGGSGVGIHGATAAR